ncbi:hypothetical protein KI659_12035 [Litoribacter alkaliphilus]|uniref:Uncharacterized protein n=1 Tax=Litoribacter ruber TaxID=702568 RepID=A0AAP2CJ93_9BACT|nr:hypothetical protein [Litoribacter alkaliphilus]MBS9524739.1 hypothetical protein [Litoribacter alkaliphilus]
MMFTIACVPEEPFGSENQISDPEILKAKAWFESQETNLSRDNGENLRNNSSNFEKRPNWNLTKKHKNAAGQEVLEVSLQVNKTMVSRFMLEKFKNNRPRPHQISQNLLMVEKGNGEYDVFIFKIHSETDLSVNNRRDLFYEVNYGKTPSDFSGELIITTLNENLIKGWRVNDGKTLMRFRAATGKKIPNSANLSGTCGYTETESCQVTTSMEYDSFLEEETMSSELNCTTTYQYECIDADDNSQGPISEEPDPLAGTGGGLDSTSEPEVEEDNFKIDMKHLSKCHQILINTLIGSTKEEFKKIFQKFAGDLPAPMNFHVEIKYGYCGPGVTACTNPKLQNNKAIISLNEAVNSSATELSIGRTILHETLHAYLLFVEQFPGEDKSLNALINAYIDKYGDRDLNPSHHNLFVEQAFIYDIAEELKNFATSLGYPTSILEDHQFFMDMAWGGLHQTDVYQQLSDLDKDRIRDHYYAERNGEKYLGTEPKGTKACEPSWQDSTIQ